MMGEQIFNMPDENLEQHIVTLFEKLENMRRDALLNSNSDFGLSEGRVPARLELRTFSLWKAVLAECVASFLYTFIVCGAATGAGVGASTSAILLATALASGCAMGTLSFIFSNISGAHINPAVSVSQCVRRRVTLLRTALYVAAQCGGSIAGAAAIYGCHIGGHSGSLAAALPSPGGAWERLGSELVLAMLVSAAHASAAERRFTAASPLVIAATYTAAGFVSPGGVSAARALGPAFLVSRWEGAWAEWAAALGGGAAVGALLARRRRRPASSRASSPAGVSSKPPHYRSYLPRPEPSALERDAPEPLYSGTKSLYCRSPPPARHASATLHRSQSVYSKGVPAAGPLVPAHSLMLRPPHGQHGPHPHLGQLNPHSALGVHLAPMQNAHNAQRDPLYGLAPDTVRHTPPGAAMNGERRESIYSGRSTRGSAGGQSDRQTSAVGGAVSVTTSVPQGGCARSYHY